MPNSEQPTPTQIQVQLEQVSHQLETVDENENPIERTSQLEELWEEQDWLETEMTISPPLL